MKPNRFPQSVCAQGEEPPMTRWGGLEFAKLVRLAPACLVGLPLLSGCDREGVTYSAWLPTSIVRAAPPEQLPAPKDLDKAALPEVLPAAETASAPHLVPICLDTVLRLAEEQNAQIALARARVEEANAEVDLAGKRWFPDLYVGTIFNRHEGGIQNEDGTLTHSSSGGLLSGAA